MHKNRTAIYGKIVSIEDSHKIANDSFKKILVSVPRFSGANDVVPFVVSERLLDNSDIKVGTLVESQGEMRTVNKVVHNKNRLIVFNYVHAILPISQVEYDKVKDKNIVHIQGYVVKSPVYRETHKKRKIAELIVAHNRSYNKESYLPSIAWGNDAVFAQHLKVGDEVDIRARFQSRDFFKKDGSSHVAYELSVMVISTLCKEI